MHKNKIKYLWLMITFIPFMLFFEFNGSSETITSDEVEREYQKLEAKIKEAEATIKRISDDIKNKEEDNDKTGSPVQISLYNPIQAAPEKWNIYGFKTNILYGKNKSVWGIDFGIASNNKYMYGLQTNLILNSVLYDMIGIQFSLVNYVDTDTRNIKSYISPLQASVFCNLTNAADVYGIQFSSVNWNTGYEHRSEERRVGKEC